MIINITLFRTMDTKMKPDSSSHKNTLQYLLIDMVMPQWRYEYEYITRA